jgi:hypothetical protein
MLDAVLAQRDKQEEQDED